MIYTFLLHATKGPFIVIHWSFRLLSLFSAFSSPTKIVLSTYRCAPTIECTKQNPNLNTIIAVTTIVTNYNRSNHISSSRLIFFIICLLIRLWSILFFHSLLAIVTQIIYKRMNERNQRKTNTQLGIAWMSFVFSFRSCLVGRTFSSASLVQSNHLMYLILSWWIDFVVSISLMMACICTEFFIGHKLYEIAD